MATSPGSTLVPLRRLTRARIERLRGDGTFDAAVVALLDAAPPGLAVTAARPRPGPRRAAEPADRRSPEKQLLLRDLARAAWQRRVESGELVESAPRLIEWTPRAKPKGSVMDVEWPERRGFAP